MPSSQIYFILTKYFSQFFSVRSWGVVMSNLCDENDMENVENVPGNLPVKVGKGKGKGTSKDPNSGKAGKLAMKAIEEVIADIDFEVRFTPLKKKTSSC